MRNQLRDVRRDMVAPNGAGGKRKRCPITSRRKVEKSHSRLAEIRRITLSEHGGTGLCLMPPAGLPPRGTRPVGVRPGPDADVVFQDGVPSAAAAFLLVERVSRHHGGARVPDGDWPRELVAAGGEKDKSNQDEASAHDRLLPTA